jgi:hypothetical protein
MPCNRSTSIASLNIAVFLCELRIAPFPGQGNRTKEDLTAQGFEQVMTGLCLDLDKEPDGSR